MSTARRINKGTPNHLLPSTYFQSQWLYNNICGRVLLTRSLYKSLWNPPALRGRDEPGAGRRNNNSLGTSRWPVRSFFKTRTGTVRLNGILLPGDLSVMICPKSIGFLGGTISRTQRSHFSAQSGGLYSIWPSCYVLLFISKRSL